MNPIKKLDDIGYKIERFIEKLSVKHLWIASFLGCLAIVSLLLLMFIFVCCCGFIGLLMFMGFVVFFDSYPVMAAASFILLLFLGLTSCLAYNLKKHNRFPDL